MSKEINLNPKVLQKRNSKGHENEVIIIVFFIFLIGLFFFGTYQYINYRNLIKQMNSLQVETQGLNFQNNNMELSKKIDEKNKEIKSLNGLKSKNNYYNEIHNIEKYEPKGIIITGINADKNGINITGIAINDSLVPIFLKNLKESKEYSDVFLNNMQNIKEIQKNKIENTKNKNIGENSANIASNTQDQNKSIEQTFFTIQIGGNNNGANEQS
ncbi:PilN domain-containing protein [uncultured Clostridium sp.]|uniref:PilN domain-containing protein n=1 Tax=uncultured Clostridium sp. TaxID=59620 RepID=UPI0026060D1B|nr:PilN domain-containing protein [uncultured Clostridium sp.]